MEKEGGESRGLSRDTKPRAMALGPPDFDGIGDPIFCKPRGDQIQGNVSLL